MSITSRHSKHYCGLQWGLIPRLGYLAYLAGALFLLTDTFSFLAGTEALAAGREVIAGTALRSGDEDPAFPELNRTTSKADLAISRTGTRTSGGQVYPVPKLERVYLNFTSTGNVKLDAMPPRKTQFLNRVAGVSSKNDFVFYTLDPRLQAFAESMVRKTKAPHVAIVAMDPESGRILAIAEKSNSIKDLSLHSGFPAASLFKLVTASAALEKGSIAPDSRISFRGGTYSLETWNYRPDAKKDRRFMTVAEALGRSCNPVFGRIALRFLSSYLLKNYAESFGFNSDLDFDTPLSKSSAYIPGDEYNLSRTAAGFGEINISPVHAATMMSGIANGGILPKPALIDKVISPSGTVKFSAQPEMLWRIMRPATAKILLNMMETTTTIGTSRKEFMRKNRPVIPDISVAAKTGTLKGNDPKGINNWFIAAAPIENPKIALSVIVVNPSGVSSKASHLGRRMLEEFFEK